jgi:hypothetical protein
MNTTENIIKSLDEKVGKFKQPVTILSKTDENEFIVNDTEMYDWDEVSKLYGGNNPHSSVDAIYFSLNKGVLTIYLFEFKNISLYDKFFNARKQLEDIINDLDECVFCCCYPQQMRKIKRKLISKKIISLKTKPLESLILLHNILNEFNISSDEIVKIRKEYYIVSKTPITGNKSNWHRQRKNKEIFDFIDKIRPFPFTKIGHLNENSFLSLINCLEEKNEC